MKIAQHIIITFLAFLIAIAGYIFHFRLINRSMMEFDGVSFIVTGIGPMGNPFLFLLILFSVGVLYFIVNKIVMIRNIISAILFLLITYLSGALFWWLRLKYLVQTTGNYKTGAGIHQSIGVNSFQFEIYTLIGLITGAILSALVIKRMNRIFRVKNQAHTDLLD